MPTLVSPKVYLVGYSTIDMEGMLAYLADSGNGEFASLIVDATHRGISLGEILCSFYAKVCYASLTLGKNDNVEKIRDIPENIIACFSSGHGSIFEHVTLNFMVRDCSRVFTHELIRHRAGTKYDEVEEALLRDFENSLAASQTSGRYVRTDELNVVNDRILQDYGVLDASERDEIHAFLERYMIVMSGRIDQLKIDFAIKKKLTSAMRRWLPNGQANEIGFTVNLRSIRHIVQLRTNRGAEKEIRGVFADIYLLLKKKFPLLFYGAKEEMFEGSLEVTGMKIQPYEKG